MGLLGEMFGKLVPMRNQEAMRPTPASEQLQEIWAKDTKRRKPREQQWQLNMAMVLGNQWVGWNGTQVQTLNAPSWRIQAVDNKLFVRVRSKMGRLTADMTPQCIPETAEQIDIRRAKYKERLLSHIRREIGDFMLRFRAAQWLVVCGEVYTEVYWNESAGDTYADDGGAFSEGDVAVKIHDPFSVWPGAGCSAGNNGGRIWTAEMVPVELARLKYGDPKIDPDAGDNTDVTLRSNMDNFFQTGGQQSRSWGDERAPLDEMVLVKTLREYRTAALPGGRKRIVINNRIYDEQPLTWDGLTHIINFPSFASYHGDPVEVRISIQRQKSYNRLLSNAEEYIRTMAKGKILCHKSNNIKSSQFDSEHLEIVKYEGSGPAPTPWMVPPMPSDTYQLMSANIAAIDDAFADHAASQGKAPASASGSAINYLQEEDQRQHYGSRDSWLAGWSRTYEKCLDVVAGRSGEGTGYDDSRMITVLGEDRRADVQRVDVDMLDGKNRVLLVMGGALPENKTLRAEVTRRMFVDGFLGDPADKETRRKALKMLDAGLVDDVYDDEYADEIRAEKENLAMAGGALLPPRPEDDHLVHIRTHKHWMKSDDFLELPPDVQEVFYDHLALHEQEAAMEAVGPLAGLMPPPGGPAAASSPAAENPQSMLKSAVQSSEPPPPEGDNGQQGA